MQLRKKTRFIARGEGNKRLEIKALSLDFATVQREVIEVYEDESKKEIDFILAFRDRILKNDTITSGDVEIIEDFDVVDYFQLWFGIDQFIKDETNKAFNKTERVEEERETENFTHSSAEENIQN